MPSVRPHRLLAVLAALLTAAAMAAVPALPAVAAPLVTDGRSLAPVVLGSAAQAGVRWARPTRSGSAGTTPVSAALTATAPTTASGYAFMAEPTPGDPIRWASCVPVHWVFDPNHAPAGGLSAVRSAVARVATATGLTFVYDGTSTAVPTSSYLTAPDRPLLIGWSTATESTLLAGQPANLVGMTQSTWVDDASGYHITSGVIAFSDQIVAPTTGANSWYTYALHELGHAVGLAHTSDTTQIMHASIPPTRSDYGTGDLTGLRLVGSTGC